jgi:hypothetical protein
MSSALGCDLLTLEENESDSTDLSCREDKTNSAKAKKINLFIYIRQYVYRPRMISSETKQIAIRSFVYLSNPGGTA